jgi:hypothetical protein
MEKPVGRRVSVEYVAEVAGRAAKAAADSARCPPHLADAVEVAVTRPGSPRGGTSRWGRPRWRRARLRAAGSACRARTRAVRAAGPGHRRLADEEAGPHGSTARFYTDAIPFLKLVDTRSGRTRREGESERSSMCRTRGSPRRCRHRRLVGHRAGCREPGCRVCGWYGDRRGVSFASGYCASRSCWWARAGRHATAGSVRRCSEDGGQVQIAPLPAPIPFRGLGSTLDAQQDRTKPHVRPGPGDVAEAGRLRWRDGTGQGRPATQSSRARWRGARRPAARLTAAPLAQPASFVPAIAACVPPAGSWSRLASPDATPRARPCLDGARYRLRLPR